MRSLSIAIAVVAMTASPAFAAQCRDHGKFVKCPPTTTTNVVKDAKGKCHVASGKDKGKFTKCP